MRLFLEIFIKVVGDPPAELRSDNAFYAFAPTFRATPLTVRVSLVEGHGAHVGGHHEDVVNTRGRHDYCCRRVVASRVFSVVGRCWMTRKRTLDGVRERVLCCELALNKAELATWKIRNEAAHTRVRTT